MKQPHLHGAAKHPLTLHDIRRRIDESKTRLGGTTAERG
jgi:hypothetical protein